MQLALLICTGTKAIDLLNGQSSCDLLNLPETQATIGAFCTPKGKVYATAIIHKQSAHTPEHSAVHILLDASLLDSVQQQLQKYLPFFRCKLSVPTQVTYHYTCDNSRRTTCSTPGLFAISQEGGWWTLHCAHQKIRYSIDNAQAITEAQNIPPQWQQRWYQSGYVLLTQAHSEQYTPNMLNFDRHAGVSFTKGCYTGQEVVARTYYKGQVKRRVCFATTEAAAMPTALLAEHTACGTWLDGVRLDGRWYGQAMIKTDAQVAHSEHGDAVTLTPFKYE